MNASDLIKWLGHSPDEPEYDAFLRSNRIHNRPNEDESDTESLIDEVERDSIALIYEERVEYEKIYPSSGSTGRFVLKQIAFYSESMHDYPGFKGLLPLKLSFEDSSNNVRTKLGQPSASREVHGLVCELYLKESLHINISYNDTSNHIGIIHVRQQHLYDIIRLQEIEPEKKPNTINIESLIKCIGYNSHDISIEKALDPIGWRFSKASSNQHEITELIRPYGLTLYFSQKDSETHRRSQSLPNELIFTGFRVNRRGDMQSKGFAGKLPYNIEFYDTPDDVLKKLGSPPDSHWTGDDIGFFKWNLTNYILHVMFSLIDYQVYRVSCFANSSTRPQISDMEE